MKPKGRKFRIVGKSNDKNGRSSRLIPITCAMGLNDELEFKGKKLHIQTENAGRAGTCIITQVFCDGRVVHTTKSFLRDCREARDFTKAGSRMHAQHYRVIREIEDRKEQITSAF